MNWLSDQNSFLAWEVHSRDTIEVKRCYVDVTGGDLIAGILLSQIIYWHLPDHEGQPRLRIERDGYKWLAKKRDDWWKECRITPRQFDLATKLLQSKNLIKTATYKFGNSPIKHIRIDWENFLNELQLVVQNPPLSPERIKTTLTRSDQNRNLPKCQNPNLQNDELELTKMSNLKLPFCQNDLIDTEITTKITSEITHNAPPLPGAPPTQKCVCEDESIWDIATQQTTSVEIAYLEEPTPKLSALLESYSTWGDPIAFSVSPWEKTVLSASLRDATRTLLKKSESSQQTDQLSSGLSIAAGSFDSLEITNNPESNQASKPKRVKFQSIEDLIDQILLDPSIMASDSLPAVYKSEIKMRGWRFPWRTTTRDKIYQTCDRRLVELIAKERAGWSQVNWSEKIPTVMKSIGNMEATKGGLEELMSYWHKVLVQEEKRMSQVQTQATPSNISLAEAIAQDKLRRQQEELKPQPELMPLDHIKQQLLAKLEVDAVPKRVQSTSRFSHHSLRELEAQLKLARA
jgi:hypothetical protein